MRVIKKNPVFDAEMFHSKGHIPKGVYEVNFEDENGEKISEFRLASCLGPTKLNDGDWVLTREDGNKFRVSKNEFHNQYERGPE